MNIEFLLEFLEKNNTDTITRKHHSYLTFYGLRKNNIRMF